MTLSEEKIYIETKNLFLKNGWTPLGGDPPRGTDLPKLEIKEPDKIYSLRKNKNSIINDLVFCKNERVALIECKDSSKKIKSDVKKLKLLCNSRIWRQSMVQAMEERFHFERFESDLNRQTILGGSALIPVLAFHGRPIKSLKDFVQIAYERDGERHIHIGGEIEHSIFSK